MKYYEDKIIEDVRKHQNKLNGHRVHLMNSNTYSMECPYCDNAISYSDVEKKNVYIVDILFLGTKNRKNHL